MNWRGALPTVCASVHSRAIMSRRPLDYEVLTQYAGDHLLESVPTAVRIGAGEAVSDYAAAVYVALGLTGEVLYVGSVCRPENPRAVGARLAEHLRRLERFQQWDSLLIFPLKPDTSLADVRRIEGRIGAHLRPSTSKVLPSLRRAGNRTQG